MRYTLTREKSRKFAIRTLGVSALAMSLAASGSAWAGGPNPYLRADESWITISGSVESVQADRFALDYGDGTVIVEMDDGDRDADAYKLVKGDNVTVTGRIDDDFFELTTIEAGSVFVENLGTTFLASTMDEESWGLAESSLLPPIPISRTVVSGTVSQVSDSDHEFMINTGDRVLRVDVGDMPFDPLDDEGYLKIDEGDRVKVFGKIDVNLFEGRRLEADTVVELRNS
jgi:uncharacterized protein YdeI (BOF family)